MINESITFDKLPQAVSYLTEQVIELKQMVSALQPTSSANNHILVEIDEAAIIIMKSKPTIYRLVNQGILPSYKKGKMPKPLPTSYIDENIMRSSLKCYEANNLFLFLSSQFGETATLSLVEKYHVGTSKHWTGATVFWQVDNQGKVRTGKVMLYYPETGKRVKEPYNHVSWVHSIIPHKDFNLSQCFFGEHLINKDKTRPIALVESEKTALIASYYLPQFLWIASGGKNGCFNTKSLSVLKNRDVVLFPDLGATTVWQDKLPMMQVLGIRATLFDFLEHQACEEDKAKGLDIADYLLKIKPAEAKHQALIKQNPAIRKLIDVFKLEIVDEPKPHFRSPKRQHGFRL